jgi:hypothetical protein
MLAGYLAARPAGNVELGIDQLCTSVGFVKRHLEQSLC